MEMKTNSLCFNKEEFSNIDFSVDKFVSECRQHASLEEMRENLGIYHKILCSAMIELINKDYADFVNLSSNLVGLDKSLKNLSTPLQNLKDEVNKVKWGIESTLQSAKNKFSEKMNIYDSKVALHHVLCVFQGLEKLENLNNLNETSDALQLEILEKAAFSFNYLQFHMSRVLKFSLIKTKQDTLNCLSLSIKQHLERIFVRSFQNQNIYFLQKILEIYSVIGEEEKIEMFFQSKFVKPFMNRTITQSNVAKYGLNKIYSDILSFISHNCFHILSVTSGGTKSNELTCSYDFLVNAVWPEIMDCFEHIAPVYLNSPGDPQHFLENYTASLKFLDEFEHYCKVKSSVRKLREKNSYYNFLKSWNLDIYFQIRFQEITSEFESSLFNIANSNESDDSINPYVLKSSYTLLLLLRRCWSAEVFLPPLLSSFLQLSFQIIARYKTWTCDILKEDPIFLAKIVKDVSNLIPDLKSFFKEIVFSRIGMQNFISDYKNVVDDTLNSLKDIPNITVNVIVDTVTCKCLVHLKQINDIPRLYRRTNRDIPTKPSSYVLQVFKPLEEFSKHTKSMLPEKWNKYCQLEITKNVLSQCYILINDVLTSIKKMGESLKILKRAREKTSGQIADGSVTDDDKIKRQLSIDVVHLEEFILNSGLKSDELFSLKELKNLVTSAERNFVKL